MKKTLIALMALAGVAMADLTPTQTIYGNDTLTLNEELSSFTGGITVVAKLDVDTFKSYMTGVKTMPTTLINVICHRNDNAQGDVGVRSYTDNSKTGLCGTWNGGGTYNFNMGAGVLNAQNEDFWTNVTGVSLTFISKLNDGVASGSGSTEDKGCTALLTLQKSVDGVDAYSYYGGQWYDGLFSSKFDGVNSITFDDVVLGAQIYYSGVTVAEAKTLGISGINAIPEPATATLSLLALAGLAARRRRK